MRYRDSQILVEIPDSKDFSEHRKETKFGQPFIKFCDWGKGDW